MLEDAATHGIEMGTAGVGWCGWHSTDTADIRRFTAARTPEAPPSAESFTPDTAAIRSAASRCEGSTGRLFAPCTNPLASLDANGA
ncbi:MAG TPA: hypothetical protein DCP37_01845 [Dehalococcoidia bacterium]|nr:hypothetical protein [Dehalococcoidia bacterium]